MAGAPSALDIPLHADLGLLAQRRRGLLRDPHQAPSQAWLFQSVVDLQAAINCFLDDHNASQSLSNGSLTPKKIIEAVRRGHQALDSIH